MAFKGRKVKDSRIMYKIQANRPTFKVSDFMKINVIIIVF